MVIKEGYKQTEIGLIPKDWEVKNLLDNFTIKARIGWQGLTTAEYLKTGDYGLVTGTDFKNGYIDWDNCVYVERERFVQDKNIQLKIYDVLVTKDGTIGKVAFVDKLPNPTTLNSGVFVIRPKNENINNRFFYYLLMSFYFDSFLAKITAGSTITHLYQKDFVNFNFIHPTLAEQTAIATALSDADGLITSLEELIAKKRNIKQGAMQQLLQPKEGWEVKKLGELGKVYGGLSGKSKIDFHEGKYPYIPFMNIMSNSVIDLTYLDYVNIKTGEFQNQAIKGDLFFNGSSETPEEVGMCSALLEDIPNLYLNSFCFGYRLYKEHNADSLYLSYFFRSDEGRNLFYAMAQGATRYNLSKGNFLKLEIKLPKPEEQTRIARILSDMHAELSALEQKLKKYKKIKLGIMQELLTGKTRLV